MLNRWYDPTLARFISRDPLGFIGGLNLYRFAQNNPLKYSDSFGLQCNGVSSNNFENSGFYNYVTDGPALLAENTYEQYLQTGEQQYLDDAVALNAISNYDQTTLQGTTYAVEFNAIAGTAMVSGAGAVEGVELLLGEAPLAEELVGVVSPQIFGTGQVIFGTYGVVEGGVKIYNLYTGLGIPVPGDPYVTGAALTFSLLFPGPETGLEFIQELNKSLLNLDY